MDNRYLPYIPFTQELPSIPYVDDYTISVETLTIETGGESFFDVISNLVSAIYKKLKEFVKMIYDNIMVIHDRFMNLDYVVKRRLDSQMDQLSNMIRMVSSTQKNEADKYFLAYSTENFPTLSELFTMMSIFSEISGDIRTLVKRCVNDDGTNLIKIRSPLDIFNIDKVNNLKKLGIIVSEAGVKYINIFHEFPRSQYSNLGFLSIDSIHEFELKYQREVFINLRVIKEILRELEFFNQKLNKDIRDAELTHGQMLTDEKKEALKKRLASTRVVLFTVRMMVGSLLQVNRQLTYRRRDMVEAGKRAIIKTLHLEDRN